MASPVSICHQLIITLFNIFFDQFYGPSGLSPFRTEPGNLFIPDSVRFTPGLKALCQETHFSVRAPVKHTQPRKHAGQFDWHTLGNYSAYICFAISLEKAHEN